MDLVKNNFPKSLFLAVKPFVLSLSKHDRLDAVGRSFSDPYREVINDRTLS